MWCFSVVLVLFNFIFLVRGDAHAEALAAMPEAASCRTELNIPNGPIPNDKKYCFMTCVGIKLGNINPDLTLNMENQMKTINKLAERKPDLKVSDYKAVLEICKDKGKGAEKCEASKLIQDCLHAEMGQRGLELA